MPELPEVENVRRGLAACLPGKKIAEIEILVPKLVRPDCDSFREALAGNSFREVRRRGKNLVFRMERGYILCHLKMSGRFLCRTPGQPAPPAGSYHLALGFSGGGALYYHDLRRFGWLSFTAENPEPSLPLGPEPLDRAFTPAAWHGIISGRRTKLKQLLLDQERIAGLGNIYAAEALFRAGLDPDRPAGSLDPAEEEKLYRAMRAVLREAIGAGGTSIVDYLKPDGKPGTFQERLSVYRRAGGACRRCRGTVSVKKHGSRSTYYCPGCQK